MSRLANAIINGAYQVNTDRPMTDLTYGGQHGWAPNLAEYTSNQAHVDRPLSCILIEPPRMFTLMPNPEKWISSLKAFFELHPLTIEGFNAGLKVDTEEHAFGGAGEMQQEIVNVTRERSQPKFGYKDKYGRPIQTLLDYWIRYGMMDPETKFALLGTMGRSEVHDMLADWYSATCLFYSADAQNKKIDKAWLTTNMFPLGTGDITAKRDLTSSQTMVDLDIEFAGISQTGFGVRQFAQQILDSINIQHADPHMRPAFVNAINPDVVAAGDHGYIGQTELIGKTAVTHLGA